MCSSGSAPAPINPVTTAQAQTSSNVDTAKATAQLNNTNQVTPYGNLTYTSTTGADGIPKYTATQTLDAAGQQLLNTNNATKQTLATTAQDQAGKIGTMLDTPLDLSAANLDNYSNTHFLDDFNKQQDQGLSALQQQLANQGIKLGSDSYTRAVGDYNTSRSNAYDNMLGSSQQNAQSAILAQRSTPLNELIGLSSGTQIQQPSYTSTPTTGVAGTDVAGIANSAYNAANTQYQYANNQNQSMLGGLFGLGSSALMAFSDERLKEDITKEGELPDGTNVYSYRYKAGTGLSRAPQVGVMAQEVEKSNPGAVTMDRSGFRKVDYAKVLAKSVLAYKRAA